MRTREESKASISGDEGETKGRAGERRIKNKRHSFLLPIGIKEKRRRSHSHTTRKRRAQGR
jgi:hypothetical protein